MSDPTQFAPSPEVKKPPETTELERVVTREMLDRWRTAELDRIHGIYNRIANALDAGNKPNAPAGVTVLVQPLAEPAKRVETGVVQFGDDWPGIFLRGDDALPRAFYLRQFLDDSGAGGDPIVRGMVETTCALLESCHVGNFAQVDET